MKARARESRALLPDPVPAAVRGNFVVVFHSVFYVSTHGGQLPRDAAYYFGELSQFGILIFFAISGFVITSSVQRRTSGEFLWLRFLRIYPGFWLAVAVVVALNWVVFGGFAWNRGTIFGLTLLPLGDVPRPLGSIEWTLVYEVFFYALIALLWTVAFEPNPRRLLPRVGGGDHVGAVVAPSWGTCLDADLPAHRAVRLQLRVHRRRACVLRSSPPRSRRGAHALRARARASRSAAILRCRPSGGSCA